MDTCLDPCPPEYCSIPMKYLVEHDKRVRLRSTVCHRPSFPIEIWSEVFNYLDTIDLYHVSCTDHFFYDASISHLLGDQRWDADRRTVLDECSNPYAESKRNDVVHTLVLTSRWTNTLNLLYGRFRSFANVHTLRFHHFSFGNDDTVFKILHHFKKLSYVSFRLCSMPPCSSPDMVAFQSLSIRELDLAELTWARSPSQDNPLPSMTTLGALNLLTAHCLSVIRVDWTAFVARHILNPDMMVNPLALSGVHTLELTAPTKRPSYYIHFPFSNATSMFLERFINLRHLRITPHDDILPITVPSSTLVLHTYEGDFYQFRTLNVSQHIARVNLEDIIVPSHLSKWMPLYLPSLRVMRLALTCWDVEVMHCAVQTFPYVEDLRIQYVDGNGPSDDFFCSFTARFLPSLPNLKVFHLYRINVQDVDTLDVYEGFLDMKRRTGLNGLVEVRFRSDMVWRRDSVDIDDWNVHIEQPSANFRCY